MQCKNRGQKGEVPGIIGDQCHLKSPARAERLKAVAAGSKRRKDRTTPALIGKSDNSRDQTSSVDSK
jgi:hypothetical protein